jgi:hypothetical protein
MTQQHPITPPPKLVEQWLDANAKVQGYIAIKPNGALTRSWRRAVSGFQKCHPPILIS